MRRSLLLIHSKELFSHKGFLSFKSFIESSLKLLLFYFRRPNPIPILAPPDHKKNQTAPDDNTDNEKGTSSAENIDHILDNMFVQRQPYEPTISLKDPQASTGDEKSDEQLNEGMNVS